ncbi:MAG: ATP-binding protein [Opitutus sp.]
MPSLHVVKAPGSRVVRDVAHVVKAPVPARKMTSELGGRILRLHVDAVRGGMRSAIAVTSAAEARRWAKGKGKSVYLVKLKQIVSKYIGETEKNLAAAFAKAEKRDAVLVLDEADALFGHRTDVKDSHDRFANIEVNDLLQQIEEQGGIVVLTTNRRSNVEPAFMRRLRFVVTPRPKPIPTGATRVVTTKSPRIANARSNPSG